ncbi:uncharacterized protein LOC135843903 [Planococcus citri]|uniref:uncharacterized protein LOC135843903 n=1 Tax=Planococcus citri TaxID=170843 RepID=UPI0031F7B51E
MVSIDETNPVNILSPSTLTQEIAEDNPETSGNQIESVKETPESNSCQNCCCQFPSFMGCVVKTNRNDSISDGSKSEYKPYFQLETEDEKICYEYFKLLARVTHDEIVEKHRERALEELHQYRLSLLLEELRLIEENDVLYSSSDECCSQFEVRMPNKRRSLKINNKKRRFQRQKIRR